MYISVEEQVPFLTIVLRYENVGEANVQKILSDLSFGVVLVDTSHDILLEPILNCSQVDEDEEVNCVFIVELKKPVIDKTSGYPWFDLLFDKSGNRFQLSKNVLSLLTGDHLCSVLKIKRNKKMLVGTSQNSRHELNIFKN